MGKFEQTIQVAAYRSYIAERSNIEEKVRQEHQEVYLDVVDEWRGFHRSPESNEQIGYTGMLALLSDNVKSRGIPTYEAHNLCVNAELDARFFT